jgi:hypothetical protein
MCNDEGLPTLPNLDKFLIVLHDVRAKNWQRTKITILIC